MLLSKVKTIVWLQNSHFWGFYFHFVEESHYFSPEKNHTGEGEHKMTEYFKEWIILSFIYAHVAPNHCFSFFFYVYMLFKVWLQKNLFLFVSFTSIVWKSFFSSEERKFYW